MRISISFFTSLCLAMALWIFSSDMAHSQSDAGNKAESVSQEDSTYVKGVTSARARSLVGGVLGLLSVIIGWRARTRAAANTNAARPWGIAALVAGLITIILSSLHLLVNTGGFGTGGGKAGAIIAVVLGIIGATLGGVTLKSR